MTPSRVTVRLAPWWAGALAIACLGKLDERTLSTSTTGAGGAAFGGRGGAGGRVCASTLDACGALCVDTQSDNAHCGNCLTVCSNGSSCLEGECTCSGGLTLCEAGCVDTQLNGNNCGSCGRVCSSGQTCTAGKCVCPQDLTSCSDECVDTSSSSSHCGGCDRPCGANQVCSGGECADGCKASETECGKDCVDTQSSRAHCGNCTTVCSGSDVCMAGECVCPEGLRKCGAECVNPLTDSSHCGNCTTVCSGGKACTSGSCSCPETQTDCDGTCRLLATDTANCGACGKACATGQTCKGGSCACPVGQTVQNGACTSAGSGGSGGTSTGGSGSGGKSTGGAGTGGAGTGGASSGGTSTGGKSTGGSSTGGKSTGGASTGGTSTGGTTGGTSTGGVSTGGTSTGGSKSTGGSSTGGSSTGSTGCNNARTILDGNNTITVSGNQRNYVVRTPANYDSSHPYRLVVAFHPNGSTAQQLADGGGGTSTPFYGVWDLSQNSAIFVAPNGTSGGTPWLNSGNQDMVFIDAVVAQVQAGLCVDKSRIFAQGFSVGASIVYALACARTDVFRAVALHSGQQLSGCVGGMMPIAFFSTHGIADSTIMFSAGTALRDHFVPVNGCTAQSPPSPMSGSKTHICTTYSGCSSGHPVEWCAFDADHTALPVDGSSTTSWVPARVWSFFTQF